MLTPAEATIWTIGHSTRTWEEFLDLLEEHRISLLVDVRRFPRSAHVPWTDQDSIRSSLAAVGISYAHLELLGGYRKPKADSVNTGWRNGGFRGYADHMGSREFAAALGELIELARTRPTAIMCAEAVPWRCHRRLLADALLARSVHVIHILSPGTTQDHTLTPFAKVKSGRITYPARRGKA